MNRVKRTLHHLFIPSERNNYRAKLLHIDFLSFYLCLVLFVTFSFKIISGTSIGTVLGIATDITVDKLYQLTNQERIRAGLGTLKYNSELASAACGKASYMFTNNLWAHYGTDGTTPWTFILNAGYKYKFAGENLAKDFMFSDGVVQGWMNSTTHRENLLRKDYEDVGFCVSNGSLNGEDTTLVVQMLGAPQGSENSIAKRAEAAEKAKPSLTPSPAPSKAISPTTEPQVAATAIIQGPQKSGPFNMAKLPFNISMGLFALLFAVFAFDFYFAYKLGAMRVVGKHVAHFIFLGFIFISLLIVTGGAIL